MHSRSIDVVCVTSLDGWFHCVFGSIHVLVTLDAYSVWCSGTAIIAERSRVVVTDGNFAEFTRQRRFYAAHVAYEVRDVRMALEAYSDGRMAMVPCGDLQWLLYPGWHARKPGII